MSEKEYQTQGSPIACFDKNDSEKRYTVFEVRKMRETVYMDNTKETTELRSDWYRLSDGQGKSVEKFRDEETGEIHFRCPDLDGLVIVPEEPITD